MRALAERDPEGKRYRGERAQDVVRDAASELLELVGAALEQRGMRFGEVAVAADDVIGLPAHVFLVPGEHDQVVGVAQGIAAGHPLQVVVREIVDLLAGPGGDSARRRPPFPGPF